MEALFIMGFGIWNMQQKLFRKDQTRYRVGKIVNFLVSQLELTDIE